MSGALSSNNRVARLAGASWLLCIVAGIASMTVWSRIIVAGNAAATSANFLANPSLFQLGFTADLAGVLSYVAVTLFIYELLAPVNRSLSLLAAFFSLVGCAVGAVGCVLQLAPMVLLQRAPYMSVFSGEQVQALVYMFVRWRAQTNELGLIFFGFHCLLVGVLILRSSFLPRFVGGMMVLAGLGWLTFLFPPLVRTLVPFIFLPGILGEATLTTWLLAKGVKPSMTPTTN